MTLSLITAVGLGMESATWVSSWVLAPPKMPMGSFPLPTACLGFLGTSWHVFPESLLILVSARNARTHGEPRRIVHGEDLDSGFPTQNPGAAWEGTLPPSHSRSSPAVVPPPTLPTRGQQRSRLQQSHKSGCLLAG